MTIQALGAGEAGNNIAAQDDICFCCYFYGSPSKKMPTLPDRDALEII